MSKWMAYYVRVLYVLFFFSFILFHTHNGCVAWKFRMNKKPKYTRKNRKIKTQQVWFWYYILFDWFWLCFFEWLWFKGNKQTTKYKRTKKKMVIEGWLMKVESKRKKNCWFYAFSSVIHVSILYFWRRLCDLFFNLFSLFPSLLLLFFLYLAYRFNVL